MRLSELAKSAAYYLETYGDTEVFIFDEDRNTTIPVVTTDVREVETELQEAGEIKVSTGYVLFTC